MACGLIFGELEHRMDQGATTKGTVTKGGGKYTSISFEDKMEGDLDK